MLRTLDRRLPSPFEHQRSLQESEIRATLGGGGAERVFVKDVHDVPASASLRSLITRRTFDFPMVRLLCRPSGEGKSTELNYVRHLFKEFSHRTETKTSIVSLKLTPEWKSKTREALFDWLKTALKSKESALAGVTQGVSRTVLVEIDNLEHLSENALTWLIHETAALQASANESARVHFVLAGSLGLGPRLRELTHMYFTSELETRIEDFTPQHVRAISYQLATMRGIRLSENLQDEVFKWADGEKRTVNLLLHYALAAAGRDEALIRHQELQPQALNRGLAEYREYGYRSDGRMLRALRALAATPRAAVELAKLARAQAVPWASLPPHLTPVLWVHGLICERGHDACFRSPFVREMATLALGRLSRTAVFVRGYLPQDRLIPERLRKARARLTRRLTSAAFRGKLLWVYYGEVVDVDGEEVKLQLTAENAESFECVMSRAHLGLPVTPHTGFLKYAWLSKKGPREAYEFYAADDDSAT